MGRYLVVFIAILTVLCSHTMAQTKKTKPVETSDPSYVPRTYDESMPREAIWKYYKTDCKPCRKLVKTYNEAMQDLLDARALVATLEDIRGVGESEERLIGEPKQAPEGAGLSEGLDSAAAMFLDMRMREAELFNEIPAARARVRRLEILTNSLIGQIAACEKQCKVAEGDNITGSLGGKTPITKPDYYQPEDKIPEGTKPELPFDWKGPYPEVCEQCRKLANRLNEIPDIAIQVMTELEALKARQEGIKLKIKLHEAYTSETSGSASSDERRAQTRKEIDKLRRELKKLDKPIKRVTENLEKVKKNFAETLVLYNACIKTCPVKKIGYVFPNENYVAMTIGPNNEVGSSAQAANEMRDRATGAVKGAATKLSAV